MRPPGWARRRRAGSRDAGVTTLEFALVLPLALLLLGFTIVAGSSLLYSAAADQKARDLARYASVRLSDGSYPDQQAGRSGTAPGSNLAGKAHQDGLLGDPVAGSLTITTTPAVTPSAEGDSLAISVTYANPLAKGFSGFCESFGLPMSYFTSTTHTATARRE